MEDGVFGGGWVWGVKMKRMAVSQLVWWVVKNCCLGSWENVNLGRMEFLPENHLSGRLRMKQGRQKGRKRYSQKVPHYENVSFLS